MRGLHLTGVLVWLRACSMMETGSSRSIEPTHSGVLAINQLSTMEPKE